jgi:hypothetical protein
VSFVFAHRTGTQCLLDQTRFPRLELPGLSEGAATELLDRLGVVPAVAQQCWRLTHGNPLALIEGTRGLSPAQRVGEAPLPTVLPVDDRLLEDFRIKLAVLGPASLRALGVAALASDGDLDTIGTALADLGGSLDDMEAAETHQVVIMGQGRVEWRHPLLRCAAHQVLDAGERRDLHQALARVTAAAGQDDRAVWHLSQSVAGPDAEVAERLPGPRPWPTGGRSSPRPERVRAGGPPGAGRRGGPVRAGRPTCAGPRAISNGSARCFAPPSSGPTTR